MIRVFSRAWLAFGCCLLATMMAGSVFGAKLCPQNRSSNDTSGVTDFTSEQLEHFENKVRPILVERCYECHGPEAAPIEASFNMASRQAILAGGDTGPGMVVGHPEKSLLVEVIKYGGVYEMPPDTKLPESEIRILTEWVADGAPWPAEQDVAVETKAAFDIKQRKADHWCWQPPRRPAIPQMETGAWPEQPVDAFVFSRLQAASLVPAPSADRRALVRRAYFDLVGLPPTPAEVQAFLTDDSPDAFEKVIDTLLASPHFGERWARHWMDLTRFAETGGHEFDYPIRDAYGYRDYLIRAFNEDVSYKQIIHEHLAGDLLSSPRRHKTEDFNESILGTGFWFMGEAKHSPVDSREEEGRTIDNQIDVMTKSFLGLTVACARCHDHKFDAISTADYYALAGFLQSSRRQQAMLDPGRRIAASHQQVTEFVKRGDRVAGELLDQLEQLDSQRLSKHLTAAIGVVRDHQLLRSRSTIEIPGESMKQLLKSGGESEIQTIKKSEGITWQGEKQFWWKHGQDGDVWELEFELTADDEKNYQTKVIMTVARDYGIAEVYLDDQPADQAVDFYSATLRTTEIDLGTRSLVPGKHRIKFKLMGHNEAAIPSRMIGIDSLKLTPAATDVMQVEDSVKSFASEQGVEPVDVQAWVDAISHGADALSKADHPLHWLWLMGTERTELDASFVAELGKRSQVAVGKSKQWDADSSLFADFRNGVPGDWFRTGFAFGVAGETEFARFSTAGPLLSMPGTVHSGTFGSEFFGVLRSPTFELTKPRIHYRLRGHNVTIRLIVDGYVMDEFNQLLFAGCKFEIQDSDWFHWETQTRDLTNHLGHRAHIEIIDHGNGYVELDEIRFSNSAQPPPARDWLAEKLSSQQPADAPLSSFDSEESVIQSVAAGLVALINDSNSPELDGEADAIGVTNESEQPTAAARQAGVEIVNWLLEHDLFGTLLAETSSSNVSYSLTENRPAARVVEDAIPNSGNGFTTLPIELVAIRDQAKSLAAKTPQPVFALAMTDGTGEEEQIFIRGNHKNLGEVVPRRFLEAISPRPLNPPDGSGRLQLANKVTAPNNPLTSRVAVNRIWHHLFGKGIVETVDNFGVLGKPPTHPELLDYLATEFVNDGWSIKRMIKRLVMTKTYQMASRHDSVDSNGSGATVDPDNSLLRHARIRRLQAEAIRDSMLKVSGRLDTKMYGRSVPVHLTEHMQGRGRPGKSGPIDGAGRRSIYVGVRRNFLSPMMLAFDMPIPFNTTGKRNQSNVPAQALILMNDPFVVGQAKVWAERLCNETDENETVASRIEKIYWEALSRPPSTAELAQASEFIDQQAAELAVAESNRLTSSALWQDLCHVMFNLKEFIYLD